MCGREVLLLQGLDQVGPVLGVDAPQGAFPAGLRGRAARTSVSDSQHMEGLHLRGVLDVATPLLFILAEDELELGAAEKTFLQQCFQTELLSSRRCSHGDRVVCSNRLKDNVCAHAFYRSDK